MKAGIVSINLHTRRLNYGAVLHSWVFQQLMLRRDDISRCDIVDYWPDSKEELNPYTYFFRQKSGNPVKQLGAILITPGFVRRHRRFRRFFRDHLRVSDESYTRQSLEQASLPYDILFFESDVIWSPTYFNNSFDPVFFGAPAGMRSIPKVAYSASMGGAQLTDAQREDLRALLELPDFISMRERYAAQIVRALTDKPVADVLDPVLLADPGDFDPITAPRRIRQKYVLAYYTYSPEAYMERCVDAYAREHGLKVVEVSVFAQDKLKHRTITDAGIQDFLSLVRNAEAVFSNSLHATCLSLLFHREFYAMQYKEGGAKYRDVCEKFGLDDRFIRRNAFKKAAPIDWDRVDALRARYRGESLAWLDAAIRAIGAGRAAAGPDGHAPRE